MPHAIALPHPHHQAFAAALVAIALLGAMSSPEPVPGVDAPLPEAPSCVGCHDSEWPTTSPDRESGTGGVLPSTTLDTAERHAIAQHLAGR